MPPDTDAPALVRTATESDADAVAALIQEHVPSGKLLPRTSDFIAHRPFDYLVATIAGRVVGCVQLEEYSPSLAEIRSLAVQPAYQRRGIGVALVAAAEGLGVRRGYTTLFAVSNNESFFRARGYLPRAIPELDRERSEVSRFKGVFARELPPTR